MKLAAKGVEGAKGLHRLRGAMDKYLKQRLTPGYWHILSCKEWETERALRGNIAYACPSLTPSRSMLETDD